MWLFHPKGFVSIVADDSNNDKLLVRGRVKGDIEAIFPGAKVSVTPKYDYRFRASVDRWVVAARVAELAAEINYGNFKNAAPRNRHNTYLDIWTSMMKLQMQRISRVVRKAGTKKRRNVFDWQSYYDDAKGIK